MKQLRLPKKPNVVFIITDQQTWNPAWVDSLPRKGKKGPLRFPAMKRLMDNGLTFNRAHCNSCTCSPSRTTLFTGTYPAHHRVTQVLAFDDPSSEKQHNQQILASNYQNMGKMFSSAGYQVAYKGKWHITKPATYVNNTRQRPRPKYNIDQLYWTEKDALHIKELYGFDGWTYPDAGDDQQIFNFGGGHINNDRRFIDGNGQSAMYGRRPPVDNSEEVSALNYIKNVDTNGGRKPFYLVVSLVNPHDVLCYPGTGALRVDGKPLYEAGGYDDSDFTDIEVKLPRTWDESLKTKPKIQRSWRKLCKLAGRIEDRKTATKYLQFYAYLQSLVDREIDKVLTALDERNFTDDTLIVRLSDHGDMGMAHGRQRQKMYNVYQQTLNVPMIFSNPVFKKRGAGQTTEALAGLIDLMPTMASVAGVRDRKDWTFQGKDLTTILNGSEANAQDYIHFTYDDDYASGADLPGPRDIPARSGASHIRCIIEDEAGTKRRWKYAVYFDPNYGQAFEYEMYNLSRDPHEERNLADPAFASTKSDAVRERLHKRLMDIMNELGTMPDSVIWPRVSGGQPG